MKRVLLSLAIVSVAANFVLVGLLLAGRSSADPSRVAASAPATARRGPVVGTSLGAETWQGLDTPEMSVLRQQLQSAGFPPHVVRAILAARLQETFAPRFKALRPDSASTPFWKTATVDPRIRQAEFALYREQQKMLRDLLGSDAEQPEMSIYNHKRYETVPPGKLQDVKDALQQFEDRRQEIYSSTLNFASGEQQKRVQEAEKEYQATLASLLTPAELEEFNLRNSDAARSLRYELAAFDATEQEFRSIYKLRSSLEPYMPNMSQEEMQRRMTAENQVRDQIKALLGPTRAAEYQRATDYSYRQTSQLVARLELPTDTTAKIWDVKQDIEQRSNALRREAALSAEERTKQLSALADESSKRIGALLGGQRGLDAFKQNGGQWIEALKPRPTGTPPPTAITRGP